MPLKGLHIYGKSTQVTTTGAQLLKYPYTNNDDNYNFPGITVKSRDGHIKLTGITTGGGNFYLMRNVPPGAYGLKVSNSFKGVSLLGYDYANKKIVVQISANTGLKQTFTVTEEANVGIYFNTSNAGVTVDADMDILLTKAENIDTAPFEPYSAGYPSPSPDFTQEIKSVGNPEIKMHGRNLVKSYQNNKTDKLYSSVLFAEIDEITPNTQYVLSAVIANGNKVYTNENLFDFKQIIGNGIRQQIIVTTSSLISKKNKEQYTEGKGWILLKNNEGNTVISDIKDVQLEFGEAATTYKPYKEQVVTLPYTLNAIPVDSGGNYTDPDGRQWICDEIDFERGVYIQRIYRVDLTEKMTKWNTWGANAKTEGITGFYSYWQHADLPAPVRNEIVSNIFVDQENAWGGLYVGSTINLVDKYIICSINTDSLENIDNNEEAIKSFVKLATEKKAYILFAINPIETPLTEEQIASYKALHTYNGTTIIESKADLSLSYVANPKKYIDKKFAELSQAIIASASEAE